MAEAWWEEDVDPNGFDVLYLYSLNNDPTYVDSCQIEIGTQQTELLG